MMRVITVNVCGIRSAAGKGLFRWLRRQKADFICLQETKSQEHQLAEHDVSMPGYHSYLLRRRAPGLRRRRDLHAARAGQGRARLRRRTSSTARVATSRRRWGSCPWSRSTCRPAPPGPHRQASKFRFLAGLRCRTWRGSGAAGAHYILSGDWNIAHKPIDLRNWRSNQKNSGFLPEERAWMDQLFGAGGYVDAFREVRPQPDLYTWWSNRGQARANNVGWRIDYQVVSGTLAGKARAASIYKERRFSDHAPADHGLRALSAAAGAARRGLRDVLASPKMLVILVLGAASGFPNQITESALQAWLKDTGVTNTTIGIISYVALPYLLKPLWAPFIDRYPLPFLGRRRGWILATQLALAAASRLFALQNPAASLAADRRLRHRRSCSSPPPRTSPSTPTAPTSSTAESSAGSRRRPPTSATAPRPGSPRRSRWSSPTTSAGGRRS